MGVVSHSTHFDYRDRVVTFHRNSRRFAERSQLARRRTGHASKSFFAPAAHLRGYVRRARPAGRAVTMGCRRSATSLSNARRGAGDRVTDASVGAGT